MCISKGFKSTKGSSYCYHIHTQQAHQIQRHSFLCQKEKWALYKIKVWQILLIILRSTVAAIRLHYNFHHNVKQIAPSLDNNGNYERGHTLMWQKPHCHFSLYESSDKQQQIAVSRCLLLPDWYPQAFLKNCSSIKKYNQF